MLHIRTLQKASRIRRFAAFYIDHMLIVFIVIPVIFFWMDFENGDLNGFMLMLSAAMIFGVLLMSCKDCINGVSPGRWLLRIAVRDANNHNQVPAIGRLMLRNLFTVIWPVEFLALLFRGRRIGDLVSDTDVILYPDKRSLMKRIAATVIPVVITIVLIVLLTISVLKESDAYKTSIRHIEQNEKILQATHGITGYGWLPSGQVNISNGHGKANFSIQINGTVKDVTAYVYLIKRPNEAWKVQQFEYTE